MSHQEGYDDGWQDAINDMTNVIADEGIGSGLRWLEKNGDGGAQQVRAHNLVVIYEAQQPKECRGFVPRSGFGANRTCSVCGQSYEAHPVRV